MVIQWSRHASREDTAVRRRYHFVQTDVFTDRPFGGNQLAVFTDGRGLSSDEMQALAREMNFSESTFVLPADNPEAAFRVRIFTPLRELPMAGHPTVGTSYVLAASGALPLHGDRTEHTLELGIGPMPVAIEARDGQPSFVWMTQPRPRFGPIRDDRARVASALGVVADDLHPTWPVQVVSTGIPFLLVPLRSLDAAARCRPDIAALAALFEGGESLAALLFTTETTMPDVAAHARMFAPHAMGIPEDPATGSAAGPLGAYLARHAGRETRFVVEQGVEMGRPSRISVEVVRAAGEVTAVRVGGTAVTVGEGEIFWDSPDAH